MTIPNLFESREEREASEPFPRRGCTSHAFPLPNLPSSPRVSIQNPKEIDPEKTLIKKRGVWSKKSETRDPEESEMGKKKRITASRDDPIPLRSDPVDLKPAGWTLH